MKCTATITNQTEGTLQIAEQPIYGSARIGLYKGTAEIRMLGTKQYELSNHLGNVLAVVTDNIRLQADSAWAQVVSATDYYAFGGTMPGRSYQSAEYRYGFNGKEKDDSGEWGTTAYDYGFRIYNPRIAKFLSVDPLTKEYPWYTPYQFAGNKPIMAIDVDGLEDQTAIDGSKLSGPFNIDKINDQIIIKLVDIAMSGMNQKPTSPERTNQVFIGPNPYANETIQQRKQRVNGNILTAKIEDSKKTGRAISPFVYGGGEFSYGFAETTAEAVIQAPSVVLPELAIAKFGQWRSVYKLAKAGNEIAAKTSTSLVKTGTQFSKHSLERLAQRGVTQDMAELAISKGQKFYDPLNKSINYVLPNGFASGKSLLVGTNPLTGEVTTVIRSSKNLINGRFVPIK